MASVQLRGLTKRFGDVVAVDNIDLEIADRELIVFVGPSGCGKTTTLRMIAGLEEITAGDIQIGERIVNRVRPKDRNIAMVFQSYALYPHMTIYDNMAFGLKMRRTPKNEIQERVASAAEILGLEDLLKRKPGELSGGQQQRVAVGRAIVRDPEVFLFDEPLSNLDAKLRVKMRTELVKLHRRLEATMVYVTHDQVEAMMMGDRIVVMHEGRIQQVGSPAEVYAKPANRFVAQFVGAPPMNIVPAVVQRDGDRVMLRSVLGLAPAPAMLDSHLGSASEKPLLIGIRPEHIGRWDGAAATERTLPFDASVLVAQTLGAEMHVELSVEGEELTARTTDAVSSDGESKFAINLDRAHFFDADSEHRIE